VKDVSVDGTTNFHGPDSFGYDEEVALSIEVSGAAYFAATGKPAQIQVYWSADLARAVGKATADGCDVCSISWGQPEDQWALADALGLEAAAAKATDAGMVLFAGAGDNNSSDGESTPANVDLPASCPHFIGCGGTTKTSSSEVVWNNDPENAASGIGTGTGGGFSTIFTPLPSWQIGAPTGPGRMVPDVAGNADPNTGYNIVVHGNTIIRGGTSAVAPLYAGLFAAFGKKLHWLTPTLWKNPMCFNDIQNGNNGKFRADRGPDPCTGLGSPIGSKLATLFPQ
jgi:kumamolisin